MHWLSRLSVSAKLAAIAACALLVIGALAVSSLLALRSAGHTADEVFDHEMKAVQQLALVRAGVGNLRRYEKDMFLNLPDEDAFVGYREKWRAKAAACSG